MVEPGISDMNLLQKSLYQYDNSLLWAVLFRSTIMKLDAMVCIKINEKGFMQSL